MLMSEERYVQQIRMMAKQLEIRDWEISVLKHGVEVLASNEDWICGEYQNKASNYYGSSEKEIALMVLEKLSDR